MNNEHRADHFAVSSLQRRQWEIGHFTRNRQAQLMTISIAGDLDFDLLETSVVNVLHQHEIFRTRVSLVQPYHQPFQVLEEAPLYAFERYELRPGETVADRLAAFSKADFGEAVIRFAVLTTGRASHTLAVGCSPLHGDFKSLELLYRQITAAYLAGGACPDASGDIQYLDFSEWENELHAQEGSADARYWTERNPPVTDPVLPFDQAADRRHFSPGRQVLAIPAGTYEGLERIRRDFNFPSQEAVLLACWIVFLRRYCKELAASVAYLHRGRDREEIMGVCGLFEKYLPLYDVDLSRDLSIIELAKQVQFKMQQNNLYHKHYQEAVSSEDGPAGYPFRFGYRAVEADPAVAAGKVVFRLDDIDVREGLFKLGVAFAECGFRGSLQLQMAYDDKAFDRASIQRLAASFMGLLQQFVANPEGSAKGGFLLAEAEYPQVRQFNDTQVDSAPGSILDRFEQAAAQFPEAPAVVDANGTITFRALNECANRLAQYLKQSAGVMPGDIVGFQFGRSARPVIAMLGILKADAAYLPLDPATPPNRLGQMLRDARAKVLLADRVTADCGAPGVAQLAWETVAQQLDNYKASHLPRRTDGSRPCYVIYTSGSTGTPKGVLVPDEALVNYTDWFASQYGIGRHRDEATLLFSSLAYDLPYTVVWSALVSGSALHLLDEAPYLDIDKLVNYLAAHRITFVKLTPSQFRLLVELEDFAAVAERLALRLIVLGGERIRPEDIARYLRIRPETVFVNHYGPTETTIGTISQPLPQGRVEDFSRHPTLGTPISNQQVYIVNDALALLSVGEWGEICVAGKDLALGYLNKPDLTAEKFVYLVLPAGQRVRAYLTGDLGRWLPAGRIDFHGRKDDQVKIRGYRVELGEVRLALLKYPGLENAEALLAQRSPGEGVLVACYVAPSTIPDGALRAFLAQWLPDYMIPTTFIRMVTFPLTANGKVDKAFLQQACLEQNQHAATTQAPATKEEQLLLRVWREVLRKDDLMVRDDFYAAGGDSIKAIQIASRTLRLGYKVEVGDILKFHSVKEVASRMKPASLDIDQRAVEGTVPLTAIQRHFFETQQKDAHHFNQSVVLVFRHPVSRESVAQVFAKLISHHDALRMVFRQDAGIVQRNRGAGDVEVRVEETDLTAREDVIDALHEAYLGVQAAIDLSEGPLVKVALFHLPQGDRLLVAIHHLVVDGVSWRILLEDLRTLFGQLAAGKPLVHPPKTHSFKQWAEAVAAYANSQDFLKEKPYWEKIAREGFAGPAPAPDTVRHSATVAFDQELTRKITGQSNKAYGTQVNDVLLTILGRSLSEVLSQRKILIELEGHGREQIIGGLDITRTVGWFSSLYPVVLEMDHPEDVERQIIGIKESLRGIPHHGVGYGILRYLTSAEHQADASVGVQPAIRFNYLGEFTESNDAEVFSVSREAAGTAQSRNISRLYALDISGHVAEGQLMLTFNYADNAAIKPLIDRFTESVRRNAERVAAHCASKAKPTKTPSDFTYQQLSRDELQALVERFGPIEDVYPLTPTQEGMLFHSLYQQHSTAYFKQVHYRIKGKLAVEVLKKAIELLLKRYDILRSRFVYSGAVPLQVVPEDCSFTIAHRFESLHPDARQRLVDARKAEDWQRPFALDAHLPVRVTVIQQAETDFDVIWSSHHITMDGWSSRIFHQELLDLYGRLVHGKPVDLPAVTPFKEYVRWIGTLPVADSKKFWRDYLRDAGPASAIPGRGAAAGTAFEAGYDSRSLGAAGLQDLQQVALAHGVTLNSVVRTAWGILLQKYNNAGDVVFGAVTSGRHPAISGIETMIGPFINIVPVRIAFAPGARFSDVLKTVHADHIRSEPYQYHPLAEVQFEGNLKDGFDNLLTFENYPQADELFDRDTVHAFFPDWEITDVQMAEHSHYPFNLVVIPHGELRLKAVYDLRAFDPWQVNAMLGHFAGIIAQVTADPDVAVGEITVASAGEKTLLDRFNDTGSSLPEGVTLHTLLRRTVRECGDKIAVAAGDLHLSYRALDEASSRWAAYLVNAFQVRPGTVVGIMADRSAHYLVAVLGILKAGGAYLPVDAQYPKARRNFMLDDAGVGLLITETQYLFDLDGYAGRLCALDMELPETDPVAEPVAGPHDLAYVIYTSGSTGQPKGVMINYDSVTNMVVDQVARFGIQPSDKVLQFASFSFDASVSEIMMAWCAGAALVICDEASRTNPVDWLRLAVTRKISVVTLPPGFLTTLEPEQLTFLRVLITAGESAIASYVQAVVPHLRYFNAYGPTECAVCASIYEGRSDQVYHTNVPIGTPVRNTRIYLMDDALRQVPVGAVGELCVAGTGLARGYLNRVEQTAAAFVETEHGRLYRTGDLGRLLTDGNIEFLGRKDQQVKLRGYRIELEEVECALARHAAVHQAAVVVKGEKQEDRYLVAFYTGSGEVAEDALKDWLKGLLPAYAVPAAFTRLAEWPVTQNGKIDRRALQHFKTTETLRGEFRLPETAVQEKLVTIWADVLEKPAVGITDDFFALGGHSLKAIRLMARIEAHFKVRLDLKEVFEKPTIREFALLLEGRHGHGPDRIHFIEEQDHYALSPAQKVIWPASLSRQSNVAYNVQNFYELKGPLDHRRLEEAFGKLVTRHEMLRTAFVLVDGAPRQRVLPAANQFKIEFFDFSEAGDCHARVNDMIRREEKFSFDLSQWPIMRVRVVKVGAGHFFLLLNMHHIITDAWSMELMVKELQRVYQQADAVALAQPKLPVLEIQYKDYAVWQNAQWQGAALNAHKEYWLNKFSGKLAPLQLPFSGDKAPGKRTFRAKQVSLPLSAELSGQIIGTARKHHTSPFVVTLAGLALLLHRYTGQRDVTIGALFAGRVHPALENLIGYFINLLPLRNTVDPGQTVGELLQSFTETFNESRQHLGYPYDALLQDLQHNGNLAENQLFHVVLDYKVVHRVPDEEPGALEIGLLPRKKQTGKFDWFFTAIEHDGRLTLSVKVNVTQFQPKAVRNVLHHFERILAQMCGHEDRCLKTIGIFSAREARHLFQTANGVPVPLRKDQTIVDFIERHARDFPGKVALVAGNRQLTYRQLHEASNQVANFLLTEFNVRREDIIGMAYERSAQMIVVLLGILKAGAAYLPVSPAAPVKRSVSMLKDADCKLVLTDSPLMAAQIGAEQVYAFVTDEGMLRKYPDRSPGIELSSGSLAYILFTSGSTGKPKGVLVEHRSIINCLTGISAYFQDRHSPDGITLSMTSYTFDVSVAEFFIPFFHGGTLLLGEENAYHDIPRLVERLTAQKIFLAYLPPALLKEVSHRIHSQGLALKLENLVVSVEPIKGGTLDIYRELNPGINIFNGYGPTETTIFASIYGYGGDARLRDTNIPIGKPMVNASLFVAENALRPVPAQGIGEILIGGEGVSRGYLNLPELTAEKFVCIDPWEEGKGTTYYRTGDIGKYNADGDLQFLGRKDFQFKLHGNRVEAGEIESLVQTMPGVRECVVLKHRHHERDLLVAFYSAQEAQETGEIRRVLQLHLPAFMIPNHFVHVLRMPVTSHGKTDREKLLSVFNATVVAEQGTQQAANPMEELMLSVWKKVLNKNDIGLEDNFFALGGDSISAIQIVSRLHTHGYKLRVKDVLQDLTIVKLARRISRSSKRRRQVAVTGEVPLSPIQAAFFSWQFSNIHHFNQSRVLPLGEFIPDAGLRSVLLTLWEHHDGLRLGFSRDSTGAVKCFNHGPELPLRMEHHDLLGKSEVEIAEQLSGVQQGFDVFAGPLVKFCRLRTDAGHRLLIVAHHLVIDGVSWRILLEDIKLLTTQLQKGENLLLPAKTSAYRDWALSLARYAAGNVPAREIKYWQKVNATPVAPIPRALSAGPNVWGSVDSVVLALSRERTALLLTHVGKVLDISMEDILVISVTLAFQRFFGLPAVPIDIEHHGRTGGSRLDLSRTTGWFTSIYPVVLAPEPDGLPTQVQAMKKALHQARERSVSYGTLRHLAPQQLAPALKPQVCLNYHGHFTSNNPKGHPESSGDFQGLPIGAGNTRTHDFDLLCRVLDDQLRVRILYSVNHFAADHMAMLRDELEAAIGSLIAACNAPGEEEAAPVYSYKNLPAEDLARIQFLYN